MCIRDRTTTMAGTIKYAAPELLQKGAAYGAAVDIYSLAMILFEMFSGKDAFEDYTMPQIMMAVMMEKKRPMIPEDFPSALQKLVESGWDETPSKRPTLEAFEGVLNSMVSDRSTTKSTANIDHRMKELSLSAQQQRIEAKKIVQPVSLISMKWPASSDTAETTNLRKTMTREMELRSNMNNMISESIIKAMQVVPRHLFIEPSRVNGNASEKLKTAYTYNKAIGATRVSNESSPEIIGAMLSLVKIETGARVLLVGGKGGYINSVVGQIVGINGKVITATANHEILETCKSRVDANSPFQSSMQWKLLSSVQDVTTLLATFSRETFHAIIYCGATSPLPTRLAPLLDPGGGTILAPVQISEQKQQFQMLIRSADGSVEIRKITDFGVIFEEAK